MARPVVLALFPLDSKTLIEGGNSDIKSTVVLPRMCFDPSFLLTLTFTIISYTNYYISDETAQWTSFHHTREGIRVPAPHPSHPLHESVFLLPAFVMSPSPPPTARMNPPETEDDHRTRRYVEIPIPGTSPMSVP